MCTGRTHVRVCVSTADVLGAIRVRIARAEERGQIKRWWSGEELTMAELVDRIVRTYFAHMERSRRDSRKRSRSRKGPRAAPPLTGVPEGDLMSGNYDLEMGDDVDLIADDDATFRF